MAKFTLINGVMTEIKARQEDAISEKFKDLLKKAKGINKDLSLTYDDETEKYEVIYNGQVYQANVSEDDVPKVLEKVGEALAQCGVVRMITFEGYDPKNVKDQLAFSRWASKQHKIISTNFVRYESKNQEQSSNTGDWIVTYIPQGWYEILRKKAEYEESQEDYED